jgi:magnesium transporter
MLERYSIAGQALVPVEDDSCAVWVYTSPTLAEQQELIQTHGIDQSDIAFALDPDEVPRFVVESHYTCIIWNHPRHVRGDERILCQVSTAGLFLFHEKLVAIFPEPYRLSDPRYPIRFATPMDVVFSYLHQTIQHYLDHLKVVRNIAAELEKKISKSMANEHLLEMFSLSEMLIYYVNAITSNNAVLVKLRNFCEKHENLKSRIELLDDLVIENNQCAHQAEIYSQVLSGLMDARGTVVNNNMNVLIKKLTIINVIFLPLNLLASILGMSEFSMMTQKFDWRFAYASFLVFTVVLGLGTAWLVGRTVTISRNTDTSGWFFGFLRRGR